MYQLVTIQLYAKINNRDNLGRTTNTSTIFPGITLGLLFYVLCFFLSHTEQQRIHLMEYLQETH